MKRSMPIFVVCSAFIGIAQAQNSVTIYGIIDEGLNYTNNVGGKNAIQLKSGFAQGSRLGFTGNEDLGGGMKAIFKLENGFDAGSGKLGQGGLLFGRQAYVGLADNSAGTLTLGRQYDSVVDYVGPLTANGNWAGYAFAHPYDNDNTDNSFRINNSVKYASANYSGLQFGGLYGFANQAGASANNRVFSFGTRYSQGPLVVGAAYMKIDHPGATAGGAITTTDANFIAARQRIYGAGINYTVNLATFGFVYTNTNLTNPISTEYLSGSILPTVGTLSSLKFNNYEVNAKYQVTPVFYMGAQYILTTAKFNASAGTSTPKFHTVGLMADYNLSKRSDIYFQSAYERAAGDKTGTALDNGFVPGTSGASSTNSQVLLRLALRHRF